MKLKKISILILAASLSLSLLAGCSSTTTGGTPTKKNVSAKAKKPNISQMKAKIQAQLKEFVNKGLINQTQSDKILTAFIKNAQSTKQSTNPLSNLVKDGTITQNQETSISEALRQFFPKGQETDSGKKELLNK
ncbi:MULTISPECIES: hypothetical protein [Clostridium]|uniref:hypothetical protein n=1 Tax=Clostridium TaxID=1485 RepID=UPI00082442EC|nr:MULTISPECIES: hypothetical protein [Clostridium]PJI09094.1 hypothetical protein CUB90_14985 [Clostridium sp. CT7]